MSELRHLIRDILAEELAKIAPSQATPWQDTAPRVTEERVSMRSNADLAAFVQRLMLAVQDGRLRADIADGRHVFRLADHGGHHIEAHQPSAPNPGVPPAVQYERGLVSERDVAAMPQDTRRIDVGKTVRFTPLASDELRRRGIKIERSIS